MAGDSLFEALGLPRRFHVDAAEMERLFHDKSRLLHPDRHVKADPQTRVKNALAATRLNEAYRTLRDPIRRAEHLLALEGIEISDERSGHKASGAFLAEIMELREQLMDARLEGDVGLVEKLGRDVQARRDEVLAEIDESFRRWEAGEGDVKATLAAVADALVAERYFRRFLDEVQAFEESRAT